MGKYLVTGGCGFIGSHLIESLERDGHTVRVLDDLSTGKRENLPPTAELVVGDVANATLVRQAMVGVDGCFHLAAIASVERGNLDWLGTHAANLTGAIAVFDAARVPGGTGIPVVYASSAAVYGDEPAMPLTEQSPTRPLSAYGADKFGCELHARVAGVVHGVPTAGMRFFNVYGPRQDPKSPYSGVISIFCDRLGAHRPITIFGDGQQTRDFVYVLDVVASLRAAMTGIAGKPGVATGVYNVCTGRSTSVVDLARTIAGLCGIDAEITFATPRAGEIRVSLGAPDKLRSELGIDCRTEIADGLRATLDSLKNR
ncbi:MAG TPA: NAD-dependent epimerase/dehydratase family protein [Aliidongia sp.]|uniref:NAD-dependent epimerase/dehydratase family protein n=1 Tax=Aliidongia sp. TaxID=1914230 RepID=UPI002DDCC62B|nr:NAD-dependent epimerase/dehydratase family protein [Aliidongia sp.]HEV2676027.1 NAD-dependent epimerase/dehydratase family protein [Aliidongia sp.]